jgi:DNA polymerase-3 subunit gamma/tau
MSYQVLARKWRPRRFEELVGQAHVIKPLVNALEHDRMHHAFLFTGTRGVGKTTIARILAKSLNCETGVTAAPCGVCTACIEVDEGRFIDLIEVDAASRTKVDDTRELLDNVQYAPTRGRYKVYLVDEVHMLSGHSFNALLKTLEEPPPHVKFLLATTDPQKLPVTVLSRCLQFNLKRLPADQILEQLRKITTAEGVDFEEAPLKLLARSADGSMRDGLSLLDQAIAFGGGKIVEADVQAMLGTIDLDAIDRLVRGLAARDIRMLLDTVAVIMEHGGDCDAVLTELLRELHRIALAQSDSAVVDDADGDRIRAHAKLFAPEDLQLFYQIGVMGRREMPFAPDARTAIEMTLLRMLAFRPAVADIDPLPQRGAGTQIKEHARSVPANPSNHPKATEQAGTRSNSNTGANKWNEIVARLNLSGLMRELANHIAIEGQNEDSIQFVLDESRAQILNKERETVLKEALEKHYGRALRVTVRIGRPAVETPATEQQRVRDEQQQAAVEAIQADPNVQAFEQQFKGRVNPASIRPKVQARGD